MKPTPKTAPVIRAFLEALEHPDKELTSWEEGFLASVTDRFERTGTLTDAQFERLEAIYAEKTA